jgi:enoyl-CoA hydratase/carnithine racemase
MVTRSDDVDPELSLERDGAILIVRFNRPEVMNAMTSTMADAYAATLRAADTDPEIRVVVVTGTGRAFCAGADLTVISQGPAAMRPFIPASSNLPTIALQIRKPVDCAVNGAVAGIGLAYMMATDIRFVASGARISSTFARLGLVAEYGRRFRSERGQSPYSLHSLTAT